MRLLVTRPEPEASALARRLTALGHTVLVHPLVTIVFAPEPAGLPSPGAIAVTSRNGVRALASWRAALVWRSLPVFVVGEATAAEARTAGFADVHTAEGYAAALAVLFRRDFPASRGTVLYPAARDRSVDLAAALPGHRVVTVEAYRSDPVADLGEDVVAAMRAGAIEGVLLFSRRTAEVFANLTTAAEVVPLRRTALYALSEQVAEPLRGLGASRVLVAPHPDEASLVQLLDPALARPS